MSTPTPTPTKTRATPTPTKTKTPTPTPTRFPQRIPGCNNIGPVGTPGWVFVGGFTLQNAKLTRNQVIPFLNVPGTYKLVYQHGAYKKLGKWYGVSSDLGLTYNRIGDTPVTVSFPALSGASDQRLAESQSCGTEINVNMLSSVGVMSLTFSAGASGLSNIDGTTSTYETNGSGRNPVFRVFKQIPVTPTPTPTKTKPTPTPTRTPTTTPTKTKPTPTPTRTPTTTPTKTKPTPTPTKTTALSPTPTKTKVLSPTPTATSIPVFQEICVELDENKQIQLIQGNVIPSIIFNPNGTTFYYSPTGNSVSNAQFGVIEPAYICSTDPKAFIKRRSNDWDLYWSSRLINGNYNKVCYNNHSSRMINSPYWRSVVNPSVPFNMVAQGSCSNNIPTPTPTPTSNVDIPNYPTPEGKIFTGQSIISQINSEYDVDTFWTELSTGFTYTIKVSGQNSPVIILKSYSEGIPLTPFQPVHTFVSTASAMRFDVSSAYYTGAPSSYVLTLSAKPTPAPTPTPSVTPTRALSAFPTPTPTKTKTPTPSVTPTRGEADIPWYPTPQGLITVNNLKRSKLESFYDEDTFWTYVTPGSAYAVTVSGDTKSLLVAVRDYNNGSIIKNYSPGSSFIASTTAVAFTVVSNYYYGGQFWPGIENYSLIVTSLTGGLPPVSPTPTPTKTKTPTPTPSRTPSYTWDSDATTYIQQVEARDGQALEINTKLAINTLVQGLKTDNTWNSLDVICLLAGARSLSGALVALKGPNPTNYNFTQSDYHRSIGLKGNGVDKWLDSNRLDSARPFNNIHMSVYMTRAGEPHDDERTNNNIHYCIGTDVGSYFISGSTGMYTQVEMSDIYTGIGGHGIAMGTNPPDPRPGLWGLTISSTRVELVCRELNDYYDPRDFQLDPAITQPSHKNLTLFYNGMSEEPLCNFSSHRMSCYTFGQNIDLYKLQNRLNTFFGTLSSVVSPPPLPTPTPSPTRPPTWSGNAIYSANYIPVTVQKNSNGNFDFVNLGNEPYNYGTNNPPLTCFRGANYNFNVNSGASTFALRNSYTDTTNVIGTYNNSPISGQVNNNVIMFTPLSGTPNQIVYMSPNTPELSGTITILD